MSHFTGFLLAICLSSLIGGGLGAFTTYLTFQVSNHQITELRQVADAAREDMYFLRIGDVSQYARLMTELYEQRITEIWVTTTTGEQTFAEMPSFVPRKDLLDRETTVWAQQRYSDSLRVLEDAYTMKSVYPDRSLVSYGLFRYLNYLAEATNNGYMRVGDFRQVTERLENYMNQAPKPDPLSRASLQAVRSMVPNL